jgi:hypothetical protein
MTVSLDQRDPGDVMLGKDLGRQEMCRTKTDKIMNRESRARLHEECIIYALSKSHPWSRHRKSEDVDRSLRIQKCISWVK